MTLSITGLGSGLPITDWVSKLVAIKQADIDTISTEKTTLSNSNSAISTIKSSYSSLLTSLQAVTDAAFGSTTNVFAQKQVSSADSTIVSASVTALASKQSVNVLVSQLATSTKVESKSDTPITGSITKDTKFSALANGEAVAGTMSVYVDNKKYSIDVADTDTVGGILDKITSKTGLWAGIKDGKIVIADSEPADGVAPASTKNIVVGSTSDTSNFSDITSLKKTAEGAYKSNQSVSQVNASALLTSTDAGFATQIKAGSFKIGGDTFTVDSTTTLQSLLGQINSSDTAGVDAYWDSTAGKMVITSKTQGAFNVNIENLAGNFTDVMGLTTSEYDTNGAVTSSKLKDGSQTLGDVAILKINGSEIISQSNTVTSDVSGIAGLTLTLNAKSTGTTATKLTVSADNSSLQTALSSFVTNFNTVLSQSDTATASDGYLHGESTLTSIRNNLRGTVTASVNGQTGYTSLASIGITTGAIGSSIDADTDQLVVDSAVFNKAMADNPEAVKLLLIGDGTTEGVLNKLQTQVNSSLDTTNGFFASRTKTLDTQIADLTTTISDKDDELALYKTSLETKFNLMDQMIASMQSQYSNISSLIGK